jgi:solute carrier family 6 amino acid transporter-like protein 5/7/9/14
MQRLVSVLSDTSTTSQDNDGTKAGQAEREGLEDSGRGKWSSQTEFMLTCIGYSVGLGNVWRFPYLCYKNGGGAFLIAYLVMIFLIGLPMLFLEFSFGQYFGIGSMSIFKKVCPLFQGIGIGYTVLNALVCIYYNVIIAMSLYYIFGSFTSSLPWATCGNAWNTVTCSDVIASSRHQNDSSIFNYTVTPNDVTNSAVSLVTSSMTSYINTTVNSSTPVRRTSPTDEYFRYALLNEQSDISVENLGSVRWHLCLCLVLAWLLVILFVSRGIQSTGKVSSY